MECTFLTAAARFQTRAGIESEPSRSPDPSAPKQSPAHISPREFFREALRYGASTALAFHNHPSGDPTPSREDTQLTRRLQAAGESLGVPLADHLILGNDRYHSFRAAEGWDARP